MSLLSIQNHALAIRELRAILSKHRELTWEMTRREITDRYAGQVFGTLWTIGHPLILMMVYIFAFAYIFKMDTKSSMDYTTYLLAGLIPWLAFAEVLAKSGTVIVSHSNLVKQVVFPVEVLPVKSVLAACVTELIMFTLLCVYVLLRHGGLPATYVLLPVLILFQILGMAGVCFIFASVGAFFRDMPNFLQVVSLICFYLMPVLYLPKMITSWVEVLFYCNPFSYMIWCFQDVCFYGSIMHPWAWVVFISGSLALFYGGFRVFRALKMMFGNVL